MPEHHEHRHTIEQDGNGGWYDIHDEWHEFVTSPACDSNGLWGYTSMRCSLAYRGCDDRACVCRCHDQARTVDGTTTSDEEHAFPAGLIEQRAQVHIARARRSGRKVENAIDVAAFGSAV